MPIALLSICAMTGLYLESAARQSTKCKQCCISLHRSFSAEAALDTKDAAVVEEPSRAVAVHEQEKSVKKSKKETSRAASREPSYEARILDDSVHCIRHQDIPRGVWTALLKLRGAGGPSSGCLATTHITNLPKKGCGHAFLTGSPLGDLMPSCASQL